MITTSKKFLLSAAALLFFAAMPAAAQQPDQDTTVIVPQTGYLAIHPSRNFHGPADLVVYSCFGSAKSGLSFTAFRSDTVVVGSQANSSSGLFLVGQPGTYTLTLTDDAVTGRINSTTVSWQAEAGTAYKRGRFLYKFVNEPGHVGFERDEQYAADNYQYCDLAEGEHIYLPLAENNLTKIAELMESTTADLHYIPMEGPWNHAPRLDDIIAAGIAAPTAPATSSDAVFDLQGRRVTPAAKGIYIVGGRKIVR